MSTKERVAKENLKKEYEEKFDRVLGNVPQESKDAFAANTDLVAPYFPGLHEIEGDDIFLHPQIGQGGNQKRYEDSMDHAEELKAALPDLWGVWGKAKFIARESGRILGLKENLSAETIRRYQKKLK